MTAQTRPSRQVKADDAAFAATMSEMPTRAEAAAAWVALPGGVVDGGEIVILAIKPSMWRPLFDSLPWLVGACFLAAVVLSGGLTLPGLSSMMTGQLILLVGFARLGVAIARWVPTWYVLTNRRVMNIGGVRAPRISSCLLVEVRNTYLNTLPAEKLTGLGTITFVTDHPGDPPRVWLSVARPEEVHAQIRRAIESAIDLHHGIG